MQMKRTANIATRLKPLLLCQLDVFDGKFGWGLSFVLLFNDSLSLLSLALVICIVFELGSHTVLCCPCGSSKS